MQKQIIPNQTITVQTDLFVVICELGIINPSVNIDYCHQPSTNPTAFDPISLTVISPAFNFLSVAHTVLCESFFSKVCYIYTREKLLQRAKLVVSIRIAGGYLNVPFKTWIRY